ncbi:hypothetical protein HMPREF3293_00921 [Christensenella minuta]|uniref:Uncharacterized protein n=1 Tax=Christensenella minuta TaxID=626937 RepID=A0A136Q669_9FIRM|nr:hypothetical protein HMPREF3293_00921 [Christensenella minuta]
MLFSLLGMERRSKGFHSIIIRANPVFCLGNLRRGLPQREKKEYTIHETYYGRARRA